MANSRRKPKSQPIAVYRQKQLAFGGLECHENGMIAIGEFTRNDWDQAGQFLGRITRAVQWEIGDWLNLGEGKWGELYEEAEKVTKLSYSYIAQCRWVADHVEFCVRTQKLSFTHHLLVASLPEEEQHHWLKLASEGDDGKRWTVARLRLELSGDTTSPESSNGNEIDIRLERVDTAIERIAAKWPDAFRQSLVDRLEYLARQIKKGGWTNG